MNYPVNFKNIDSTTDFFPELNSIYQEAKNYLFSFKWCKEIKSGSLYTNLGKIFCIFLFEIENTASSEDNFLWVIIGDFPLMYLDVYGPKTTIEVLEDYIRLAEDWIYNIKSGKPTNECYPFSAEPTTELAELLEKKVSFMKTTLLDNIENISLQLI